MKEIQDHHRAIMNELDSELENKKQELQLNPHDPDTVYVTYEKMELERQRHDALWASEQRIFDERAKKRMKLVTEIYKAFKHSYERKKEERAVFLRKQEAEFLRELSKKSPELYK